MQTVKQAYLMAVDQGTSTTKAVVVDARGGIRARAVAPLTSTFPQPGWVEQDPEDIYQSVLAAVRACIAQFHNEVSPDLYAIRSCGLSNQRETFLLWDAAGQPLCPALVWQCKRSIAACDQLKGTDLEHEIVQRTGLMIDPYFSGTKLLWLYEHQPPLREAIDSGRAYFGTVDTWLLYRLTQGRCYLTDYTNAARTLFFNLEELQWDRELLSRFGLEHLHLPDARPSCHAYGASDFEGLFPRSLPIGAMIGDSHAAAFGEGCTTAGTAKATLGTGCSILLNTGSQRIASTQGMVTTLCWSTEGRVDYALEGIIVTCGATITWLRDQLGLFAQSSATEAMARDLVDNQGVYLVPAFSGLGAPHWRMDMKAAVVGLTLGCDKRHLVRAALESIAYQIKDVVTAMEADSGVRLQELKVDGGISDNTWIMQFLSDLLGVKVVTIGQPDVSALGAAMLAGLQQGIFASLDALRDLQVTEVSYLPGSAADRKQAERGYRDWIRVVETLKK
jgi:glycerol kinase